MTQRPPTRPPARHGRTGARTPSLARRAVGWRPRDPGRFALRAGLRAAVATPIGFALGMAAGDDQTALFAIFGVLSVLIFADFGGPRSVRLVAYLGLALAGTLLITVGTLCSRTPGAACAAMAVIGFAVLFAGVVNGYLATAAPATLLTFILPAMVPVEAGAIPERLLGWGIACAVAVPVALLVFPARPRDRLREGVIDACAAVADLVERASAPTQAAARAALAEVHARFAATPFRPTGPTGSTGALAELIDELDWLAGLARSPACADTVRPPTASEAALRAATVAALRASGELVAGRTGSPPDADALHRGRDRVLDDLLHELADPRVRDDDAALWAALTRTWEVRVMSFVVLDVAAKAQLAGGAAAATEGGPRWVRYVRRQGIALAASGRLAAAHAGVRSVWFRNSLRGAVGLALAVLIAQEASVQHAFWVVLGALSVLRSSAVGTGRTIVQAFAGTFVGIVIGGAILLAIGDDRTALWCALPVAAFVAAYAPRAVSYAAGQAGFTVVVLVAFNLIAPTGWEVGLVRIEDVSIGFAISLGAGLLLWPRGATALLHGALGAAYAASARYATAVFTRMLVDPAHDAARGLAEPAIAAEGRLDVALRQRLAERTPHELRLPEHVRLSTGAARLRRTGDAIAALCDRVATAHRPAAATRLASDAAGLGAWYVAFGQAVGERAAPPAPHAPDAQARDALLAGVREAVQDGDRDREMAAVATVWAGLHVEQLGRMEPRVAQAAAELAAGS